MTPETQSIITVALPTLTILLGILLNNSRLTDLRSLMDKRFDDVRDLIQATSERHDANLRRVEEVIDARLKHLEDQAR